MENMKKCFQLEIVETKAWKDGYFMLFLTKNVNSFTSLLKFGFQVFRMETRCMTMETIPVVISFKIG